MYYCDPYLGCLIKIPNAEFDAKVTLFFIYQMVLLWIDNCNDPTMMSSKF